MEQRPLSFLGWVPVALGEALLLGLLIWTQVGSSYRWDDTAYVLCVSFAATAIMYLFVRRRQGHLFRPAVGVFDRWLFWTVGYGVLFAVFAADFYLLHPGRRIPWDTFLILLVLVPAGFALTPLYRRSQEHDQRSSDALLNIPRK